MAEAVTTENLTQFIAIQRIKEAIWSEDEESNWLHLNKIQCSWRHQDQHPVTDISAQSVQKNPQTLDNHIGSLKNLQINEGVYECDSQKPACTARDHLS